MSVFVESLAAAHARVATGAPDTARSWVYVPYDQLHAGIGPLAALAPEDAGIVLVESAEKAMRRPYHQQKLTLVLASQRAFALEQAARGVRVRYVFTQDTAAAALAPELRARARDGGRPVRMQEAAERELRAELAPLVAEGVLRVEPHAGFLTTAADLQQSARAGVFRMDAFYRHVRQRSGILMDGAGKPLGGRYSFDGDNRERWDGMPPAPTPPRFVPSEVTREVAALVARRFGDHPGRIDVEALPIAPADVEAHWQFALAACLPSFGPYEDAMSERSRTLFHTGISPLLNLHRLLPARVIHDVVAREHIPLQSREAFVRQVLGWREFVRWVHRATDGFRHPPGRPDAVDAPAQPQALNARTPLPPAFWDKEAAPGSPWRGAASGLRCLDATVDTVWETGQSHHITRLMVLGNIAALLDVDPRALTDWFWAAYTDAYDWVVEPNVLAMATFATGDVMTTKPYVAGSAYIDRMSDHCARCAFHPKRTCPLPRLYWDFLARHGEALVEVERMKLPLAAARKRAESEREIDAAVFATARDTLLRGDALTPSTFGAPAPTARRRP